MSVMTTQPLSPIEEAKKLAETAHAWALVGIVVIIVNTSVQHYGEPTFDAMRAQEFTPDAAGIAGLLKVLLANSILAAPSFLLVCALFDLRAVLLEFSEGRLFSLRASVALRSAGEWALWALGMKVVGSPSLYAMVTGESRGLIWKIESFDLGLVAFAILLLLTGRVLEAAAALKAENDEII